jgi:NAD(P)H-dependent FMN reductase
MKNNILIIVGATRPNNYGAKTAEFVSKKIREIDPEVNLSVISPNDFNLQYDSDKDLKYIELLNSNSKIVIVVSEYNHGYPGKLKTLLDSAYEEYKDKKVLLVGVSSGPIGGARGIIALLPVLRTLKVKIFYKDILIPFVESNVSNNFKDPNLKKNIENIIKDFLNW